MRSCALCSVTFTQHSSYQYDQHMVGKAHRARALQAGQAHAEAAVPAAQGMHAGEPLAVKACVADRENQPPPCIAQTVQRGSCFAFAKGLCKKGAACTYRHSALGPTLAGNAVAPSDSVQSAGLSAGYTFILSRPATDAASPPLPDGAKGLLYRKQGVSLHISGSRVCFQFKCPSPHLAHVLCLSRSCPGPGVHFR